jgi:nitrate reductase (cytochrome), electron transfer subunit
MATPRAQPGRLIQVILAVAIGLALIGYFTGVRAPRAVSAPYTATSPAPSSSAVPGQPYWELRDRRFGPNSRVSSEISVFQRGFAPVTEERRATAEEKTAALEDRARGRAYAGAPPVIPHAIDELSSLACLACHEAGAAVAGKLAPPMSHSKRDACTQCHVPAQDRPGWMQREAPQPWAGNTFGGLPELPAGSRAWPGAPPTLAHPAWMRERCTSCHGVAARPGLRTPHPWRPSCPQCHVATHDVAR